MAKDPTGRERQRRYEARKEARQAEANASAESFWDVED